MRTRLYNAPDYYHVAFEVNRKAETDFIEACFRKYAHRSVRDVADLACGTGHHTLRLAERGYRVTALDLSQPNIAFLRSEAVRRKLPVRAVVGDMTGFRLVQPADGAICMRDSQGHLLTNNALIDHFRAVRAKFDPVVCSSSIGWFRTVLPIQRVVGHGRPVVEASRSG